MKRSKAIISALTLSLILCGCDSSEDKQQKRLDKAITAANHYFTNTQDERYAEIGLLTQFIKRKFDKFVSFEIRPFPNASELGNAWIVVSRFRDSNYPMTKRKIKAHPNAINQMTTAALYCDKIPLPPSYPLTLRQANKLGGLYLTHGIMAAYWSHENGCLKLTDLPPDILPGQVKGLLKIAHGQANNFQDLGIEAIAFLTYVGHPELIKPEWVTQILKQQNADGGWGGWGMGRDSDPHATALALWVLLEQRHPGRAANWLPQW